MLLNLTTVDPAIMTSDSPCLCSHSHLLRSKFFSDSGTFILFLRDNKELAIISTAATPQVPLAIVKFRTSPLVIIINHNGIHVCNNSVSLCLLLLHLSITLSWWPTFRK